MSTISRPHPFATAWTYKSTSPGIPPVVSTTAVKVVNMVDTRTGYDNSNWRTMIAEGSNASTLLSGVKFKVKVNDGYCLMRTQIVPGSPHLGVNIKEIAGYWMSPSVAFGANFASEETANNVALSKVYSDIRSQTQKMSGMTFAGEIRDTLRLIRSPALLLRKGVDTYFATAKQMQRRVRRNPAQKAEVTKHLGELWLSTAFGWQPLFHDVKDAAEGLASLLVRDRRTTVTGRGVNEGGGNIFTGNFLVPGTPFETAWTRDVTDIVTVRYKCGIKAMSDRRLDGRILDTFGFGLAENFVPTVWELLPWSFLIDYFINVGEVLEAVTTDVSNVSWVNKTVRRVQKMVTAGALNKPGTVSHGNVTSVCHGAPGNMIVEKTTVGRGPSPLGYPTLYFRIPGLASKKALNIGALIAAARSSRSRSPH